MKIPNAASILESIAVSLARIVSEDSQQRKGRKILMNKSSKDS